MPANNPLNTITFEHLTEACPKMTRRLRSGAAAELAAWLQIHINRWAAQLTSMPKASDPEGERWRAGMVEHLKSHILVATTLQAVLTDKFGVMEWHHATTAIAQVLAQAEELVDVVKALDLTTDAPEGE